MCDSYILTDVGCMASNGQDILCPSPPSLYMDTDPDITCGSLPPSVSTRCTRHYSGTEPPSGKVTNCTCLQVIFLYVYSLFGIWIKSSIQFVILAQSFIILFYRDQALSYTPLITYSNTGHLGKGTAIIYVVSSWQWEGFIFCHTYTF